MQAVILRHEKVDSITTRNSIRDLAGSAIPDEYIFVSGHVDGWDAVGHRTLT